MDWPAGTRSEEIEEALERERLVLEFLSLTERNLTTDGTDKRGDENFDGGAAGSDEPVSPLNDGRNRGLAISPNWAAPGAPSVDKVRKSSAVGNCLTTDGNGWEQEEDGARGDARPTRLSGNEAAAVLGKAASWFVEMVRRWRGGGAAGLLPRRRGSGGKPSAEAQLLTEEDVKRIRFILLKSNRGQNAGSRNFAVRRYATMPDCPEALRKVIQERYRSGKTVLPPSALKRIRVDRVSFAEYRSPRTAALDFVQCPGSSMWVTSVTATGETVRRFIRPGEVVEADDGTINFVAVVPWEMGGCPCSDRFGVKVARFQWLPAIDVGSRKVLAHTYVCRAKSSYRGEDVVTLMNAVGRQWGEPDFWRFERGVWESEAVQRRVKFGGSRLWTVYSPHGKPFVEGLFHKAWTVLSVEDGQVGRFRGEMEEENRVLALCQGGHRDPRRDFYLLPRVLAALDGACEWNNSSMVNSERYGRWCPDERWNLTTDGTDKNGARGDARPPARRVLGAEVEWLAAPCIRQWRVRGNVVGGKVRLFDGCSVPFMFGAAWLPAYDGVRVSAHFDPSAGRCSAMLCLAQDFGGRRSGEVLGSAVLVDECASYARLVLEWGDDDRGAGKRVAAHAGMAMRREVRAISMAATAAPSGAATAPHSAGGAGIRTTEVRDGMGRSVKVTTDGRDGRDGTEGDRIRRPVARDLGEREEEAARFEKENALDWI